MNAMLVFSFYGLLGSVSAYATTKQMGVKGKLSFLYAIISGVFFMCIGFLVNFQFLIIDPALSVTRNPVSYTIGAAMLLIATLYTFVILCWNVITAGKVFQ